MKCPKVRKLNNFVVFYMHAIWLKTTSHLETATNIDKKYQLFAKHNSLLSSSHCGNTIPLQQFLKSLGTRAEWHSVALLPDSAVSHCCDLSYSLGAIYGSLPHRTLPRMPYGTLLWQWGGTAMWSTGQPWPVLSGAGAVSWGQCGQGMKQKQGWFKYTWEGTGTKGTLIQEHCMNIFFQRHQLIAKICLKY